MLGSSEKNVLSIDTEGIKEWRAIVTLVVFILTSELTTPEPDHDKGHVLIGKASSSHLG